jgi:predicted DNA-binding transcriptional regulator AlpA
MANEEIGLEALLRRLIREELQAALGHLNGRDRLLTAEQAAELLACSPDFLYRRVNKLPFVRRIENMVRFSERGIHAYLESKAVAPRTHEKKP